MDEMKPLRQDIIDFQLLKATDPTDFLPPEKKMPKSEFFFSLIYLIKIEILTFFRSTDRPYKKCLEKIREAKNQLCLALNRQEVDTAMS